ncbi:MAG: aminoglycoside phosphotransferase family protein [Bacteroidales bacterium]|nr:aminoglycoside phosphotransferase family protein [Bacteroidales bacterium]
MLNKIASHFDVAKPVNKVATLGEGFINDTFIVETVNGPRYILQRKNKNIFTDIPKMMENIYNVTTHLKKKIVEYGGDPLQETLTVIPAIDDKLYYLDEEGDFWAMCLFIEDTIAYQKADTPELAYMGGKGLGKFQRLLSDFTIPLNDILPGFHNMRFRFEQWDAAVKNNAAKRVDSVKDEINFIESHRKEMLDFWQLVEDGKIPMRVTHNDTKINNFLFDKDGNVLCVIDLDTVLTSPCLNDFGDAIRSYTNTGAEDDRDLDQVSMDKAIFDAYKQGYLSEADTFMTETEKQYLDFSAKYITFEQVLRFLMDYLNGDTYYKIKYPEHNLVRTRAQRKLFDSMSAIL